jgi:hypothetical protein
LPLHLGPDIGINAYHVCIKTVNELYESGAFLHGPPVQYAFIPSFYLLNNLKEKFPDRSHQALVHVQAEITSQRLANLQRQDWKIDFYFEDDETDYYERYWFSVRFGEIEKGEVRKMISAGRRSAW